MNAHKFEYNGLNIKCKYCFDCNFGDGMDVYVDGNHVGEIWGKNIPDVDLDESEDIEDFEQFVSEWLDENYY